MLQSEDVDGLCVAGGTEKLCVCTERQGTDADIPKHKQCFIQDASLTMGAFGPVVLKHSISSLFDFLFFYFHHISNFVLCSIAFSFVILSIIL